MQLLFRDVTGHPTAEALTAPYAAMRKELVRPGSTPLGLADYFAVSSRSIVEVHLDPDRTTLVALWPWKGEVVASLETLLDSGAILETRLGVRPSSTTDRTVQRAGIHLQELTGAPADEVRAAHLAAIQRLQIAGAGAPVRIRSLRTWRAMVERMVEVRSRAMVMGAVLPTVAPIPILVVLLLTIRDFSTAGAVAVGVGAVAAAIVGWVVGRRYVGRLPLWKTVPATELLEGGS